MAPEAIRYQLRATIVINSDKIAGIIDLARKKRGGRTDSIPHIQAALMELFDLVDGDRESVYKGLLVTSLEASRLEEEGQ